MKKKRKRNAKRSQNRSYAGLIAFFVTLVVVVGAYGFVGFYFSQHFLPGTTLNSSDVSLLSIDEAKQELVSKCENYKLTLIEQDYTKETIDGEDIDFKAEIDPSFDNILDLQSGLMWAMYLFEDKSYVIDDGVIKYTYDEDKLIDVIDELECIDPQYPVAAKDAELVFMDGEFKIVPESLGNVAHRDVLIKKIKKALKDNIDTIDLKEEDVYDKPKIYSNDEDLAAKKSACDEISGMSITLKFGMTEENIDIQTIAGWVKAEKDKNGNYALKTNDEKIAEYVKTLAEKYDTYDKPKSFVSHSGNVIELTTGDYGWMLDQEESVKLLKDIVLKKKTVTVDLTEGTEESVKWWMRTGVGYDANGNDYYGNTYAEVSIAEQHMWMYQNGEIVLETDVVTGNPNLGNDTPVGAFRIRYHQQNAILRGPGYATPVAYWMVFADDVGFHDATWQPYFGGELYYYNGSHGCVNMPLDQAGKLYDLVYDNMPVFVY